jgi:hypothetical protein
VVVVVVAGNLVPKEKMVRKKEFQHVLFIVLEAPFVEMMGLL